jgi:coenzyme F420-reducing hydrogenase delta subunit
MMKHAETEVVVFCCGRAVKPGAHLAEGINHTEGHSIRYVILPCSSKIETRALLKLIEDGVDEVLVIGCPEESCQYVNGSRRAAGRVGHAQKLLTEIGLEARRIRFVAGTDLDVPDIIAIVLYRVGICQ